jgi:hypothetical protein
MNYYGNYQFENTGDFKVGSRNGIRDDGCFNQVKDIQDQKKFKYYTTNHIDLLDSRQKKNFLSISANEGQRVGSKEIDGDSKFRYTQQSKCKGHQSLGELPLNMQGRNRTGHNIKHLDTEYNLLNDINTENFKRHSKIPRDNNYTNRTFTIFDNKNDTPDALKSVEKPELNGCARRGGENTRFDSRYF